MFIPTLLQDKVVIVTGGGTGIGMAIAKRLGELGAGVAIGSRNSENLEKGTAELRHAGLDPLAVQLDVRKIEQVDEMVTRVVRHFGHSSLAVRTQFQTAGRDFDRDSRLDPRQFSAHGGCFPLIVGGVLAGVAGVSGLAQVHDHALVVEALREYSAGR